MVGEKSRASKSSMLAFRLGCESRKCCREVMSAGSIIQGVQCGVGVKRRTVECHGQKSEGDDYDGGIWDGRRRVARSVDVSHACFERVHACLGGSDLVTL